MKKKLTFVYFSLLGLWIFVLLMRSFLYIKRTITEFVYPPQDPYKHIVACEEGVIFKNDEEEIMYKYKILGEKCKN